MEKITNHGYRFSANFEAQNLHAINLHIENWTQETKAQILNFDISHIQFHL